MTWYFAAVVAAGLVGVGCAALLRRGPALVVTLLLVVLGEPLLTRAVAGAAQPYGLPHAGWLRAFGAGLAHLGAWTMPPSAMTPRGLSAALVDLALFVALVLGVGLAAARRRDV